MEYRFSLTPRLIALTLFCGISLLVLLFTLGFQVGQMMGRSVPKTGVAGQVASMKADASRMAAATVAEASSAVKPLTETASLTPKAAP